MKNENWETANNTIGVNKCINTHLLFNKINKIRGIKYSRIIDQRIWIIYVAKI